MPIGMFPQLQGFLQKKRGQGQVMPNPAGYAPEQYPFQAGQITTQASNFQQQGAQQAQPKQGMLGQQMFNQEQQRLNKGLAGGRFNRRRY